MAKIYSNASLAIIASRAAHSNEGILQSRDLRRAYACKVPFRYFHSGVERAGSVFLWSPTNGEDDPIDTRGWTLQERVMSLRKLRYGSKQVTWECLEGSQVDGGVEEVWFPTGTLQDEKFYLGDIKKRPEATIIKTLREYRELVRRYSYRSLSHTSDKLQHFPQ
jgi:hypothetical protein